MSLYLISVSAVATSVISVILIGVSGEVVKNYWVMTCLSGSLWSLTAYHLVQWHMRRKRKRQEQDLMSAQLAILQQHQQLQQHQIRRIQNALAQYTSQEGE
jgi:hypothetical protein